MGCSNCGVSSNNGAPSGCGNKGSCSTGGCNRLNTFDWLTKDEITDVDPFDIIEVSFKNGARKDFFKAKPFFEGGLGEQVVVESSTGYDIGRISLKGELVRMQMKKKKIKEKAEIANLIRLANDRDIEKLDNYRSREKNMIIKARVISRSLGLEMKVGDIEFQGDGKKATFYYTAEGRVDFRELIREFAKEFKVRVEMRQIGARQESARIGGIGSCGRELCCSTWLTDFQSVNTSAARYQNLAISQAKLSGQCGRLKCCLNFELDAYVEAVKDFPKHADKIHSEFGTASLIKTDIFQRKMFYLLKTTKGTNIFSLSVERVKEILAMNKKGEKPLEFEETSLFKEEEAEIGYGDVTGVVELQPLAKRKKRRGKPGAGNRRGKKPTTPNSNTASAKAKTPRKPGDKTEPKADGTKKPSRPNRSRKKPANNPGNGPQNKEGNPNQNKGPKKPQIKATKPPEAKTGNGPQNKEGGNKQEPGKAKPINRRKRPNRRGKKPPTNTGGKTPDKPKE